MDKLTQLKEMIDERNYPYFDEPYLIMRVNEVKNDAELRALAKELCLMKAGIEEIKLGDITIPSPRKYFLTLANKYRANMTGVTVRADEY